MKTIFCIGLLMLNLNFLYSQINIRSTFNTTYTGRNLSVMIEKEFNQWNQAGIGLRYNIKKIAHNDDQQRDFRKRLYPSEPIQRWGVEGYYQHKVLRNLKSVSPFVCYDLQLSHSTTRNRVFILFAYEEDTGDALYKNYTKRFGPYTFIEQYISIGITAKIAGGFDIYQKIGGGVMFVLGKDEGQPVTSDGFVWKFAGIISAGLVYHFDAGK